jgi:hypothetical protein
MENVGIFYGHFVIINDHLYHIWPFVIVVICYTLPVLGIWYLVSGNPDLNQRYLRPGVNVTIYKVGPDQGPML